MASQKPRAPLLPRLQGCFLYPGPRSCLTEVAIAREMAQVHIACLGPEEHLCAPLGLGNTHAPGVWLPSSYPVIREGQFVLLQREDSPLPREQEERDLSGTLKVPEGPSPRRSLTCAWCSILILFRWHSPRPRAAPLVQSRRLGGDSTQSRNGCWEACGQARHQELTPHTGAPLSSRSVVGRTGISREPGLWPRAEGL